jgi:VCBS repeat-containing protein
MTTEYTIEAEDMQLDGYQAKYNSNDASGGGYIQTWSDGSASITFEGVPGTYSFNLSVFDESDGQSSIDILVNGEVVSTITLDQDEGGNYIYNTLTDVLVEGIELQPGDTIELQGTRDGGEPARIDAMTLTMTSSDITSTGPVTLLSETFSTNVWENVDSSDLWIGNGMAGTNGCWDGQMVMREVDMNGYENATLSLTACLAGCGNFEDSGRFADFLEIQIVAEDGTVIVLDRFSGDGRLLTGSETGQEIDPYEDMLTYDIPDGIGNFQVRILSDISASNEVVFLDNFEIEADPIVEEPTPEPTIEVADDAYTVGETEDVAANVFENDMLAEGASITALEHDGDSYSVGDSFEVTTASGRTGTVTVEADGSFSFDGGDNFVEMAEGETDSFQLTYTASLPGTTESSTRVIDFEGFAAGDVISNQIAGVTITAQRNGDGAGSANDAMIFDSYNPTGGDDDLSTTSNGNLLIISEDNDSNDPDDNAGGGVMTFDFDNAEDIQQITFVDTEEGAATITLTLADGSTQVLTGPQTLNGHVGTFNVGVANVVSMTIAMLGSGAIDDIVLADTVTVPGASDTATITVTINGENALMDEGESISVGESAMGVDLSNVMDNTTDPEPGQPDVSAVDGDAANVGMVVAGSNGGLFTINADGTASFDTNGEFEALAEGESTTSSITYDVTDAAGDTVTSTYTVTINGENDLADAGETSSVDENAGAVALDNVLANTVDPEAGDPVVSAVAGDSAAVGMAIAGSNGGVFSINADGTASFDTNGEFEALAEGESTTSSITYDVTDAAGDTVTSTYTVTINGENDLADAGEALTVDEDAGAVALDNVLANTVDPEVGDPVVSAVAGDDMSVGQQVAGSNGGVFTINADGTASFDTNGEFDALNDDDVAVTSITYDVTDAAGDTVTSTYTVTVNGKGAPEPETEFVDLDGNIVTEAAGKTAVAVIIDTSFTALSQVNGALVGDLNGDARTNTVVDLFLSKVVDLAQTMEHHQEIALIPAGQDSAGPALVVTAEQIIDAATSTQSLGSVVSQAIADWKAGTISALEGVAAVGTALADLVQNAPSPALQSLFAPINDNALDNTIDLDQALLVAESYLNSAGADANDVMVLTSTDGFDISTFTNVSDPAATVARMTDDNGLDADIDVVLIENGYFSDKAALDAIDSDGLADDITSQPAFGLEQLVDYAPTISAGDVLEITVNGVTQSVSDQDAATEGFQWSADDVEIPLGSTPTVLVGIDQDGNGTIASHEQIDVSSILVDNGDSFSFDLDALNPPALLSDMD